VMRESEALDRLILVSGTYHNNTYLLRGLPLDPEVDIIDPDIHTPKVLIDILTHMGQEYDEHFEKKNEKMEGAPAVAQDEKKN